MVRREQFRRPGLAPEPGSVTLEELAARITKFTAASAEGGKRAQAAVAGLLSAAYGSDRVRATRVNDPDRTLPGDVGVLESSGTGWSRVFEVRDKQVSEPDLHHLLNKAVAAGATRIGMFALSARQPELSLSSIKAIATRHGAQIVVRYNWAELIAEVAFWTDIALAEVAARAVVCIDERLVEFDVRRETLAEWRGFSPQPYSAGA